MSDPHIIRLRDPWDAEHSDEHVTLWRRRFNRPTGLVPGDQVWLVVQTTAAPQSLRLNDIDVPLSAHGNGSVRVEIASRMEMRNTIEILSGAPRDFEVWLEIVSQ